MTIRVDKQASANFDMPANGGQKGVDQAWVHEFEKAQYAEWQCETWQNRHQAVTRGCDPPVANAGQDAQVVDMAQGIGLDMRENREIPNTKLGSQVTSNNIMPRGLTPQRLTPIAPASAMVLMALDSGTREASSVMRGAENGPIPYLPQWGKTLLHLTQNPTGVHIYLRDAKVDAKQDGLALLQRLRRDIKFAGCAIAAITINGKTFV